MYSKEEKRLLVQEFWLMFDKYSNSIPSLKHKRKKWSLHRTGVNGVDLRFEPGRKSVQVMIEITHKSEARRLDMFERIESYKVIIESGLEGELIWDFNYTRDNGQEVCRIYTEKKDLDIHRKEHWPEMFTFMAEKMEPLQNNLLEIAEMIKDKNWGKQDEY